MIYQSEPVSSVLMCSEIVGFGFSICFSSSAVCLSFDSLILSLSSCCVEINFSLTSYTQLGAFPSVLCPCWVESLPLSHTPWATLSFLFSRSMFAWMPCHLFLVLVLLNLSSSVSTFHLLWLRKSLTLFPKSLITLPFKLRGKSTPPSLSILLPWGSERKDGRSRVYVYLFAALVGLLSTTDMWGTTLREGLYLLF